MRVLRRAYAEASSIASPLPPKPLANPRQILIICRHQLEPVVSLKGSDEVGRRALLQLSGCVEYVAPFPTN